MTTEPIVLIGRERSDATLFETRTGRLTDRVAVDAVECPRCNVSGPAAVAVPPLLRGNEATGERIPAQLGPDRGGIEYAGPLEDRAKITDAVHAEVERRGTRDDSQPESLGAELARSQRPVATDGDGRSY
ncbi:MAG: hypothetical protein ACI8TL_000443 [Natronomonas sp.]|jgi:hypothetical protein